MSARFATATRSIARRRLRLTLAALRGARTVAQESFDALPFPDPSADLFLSLEITLRKMISRTEAAIRQRVAHDATRANAERRTALDGRKRRAA